MLKIFKYSYIMNIWDFHIVRFRFDKILKNFICFRTRLRGNIFDGKNFVLQWLSQWYIYICKIYKTLIAGIQILKTYNKNVKVTNVGKVDNTSTPCIVQVSKWYKSVNLTPILTSDIQHDLCIMQRDSGNKCWEC